MAVTLANSKNAITHYEVLQEFSRYSYVRFRLETGRTHQIRVHAKHMGHPVVGDTVYGQKNCKFNLNGQLLHAFRLELDHPDTGERMSFEAPLPDYFERVIKILESR